MAMMAIFNFGAKADERISQSLGTLGFLLQHVQNQANRRFPSNARESRKLIHCSFK